MKRRIFSLAAGLLLVLSACILPEILIERRLEARRPYDRMLRFVSDRRPVTLDPAELLYVESNDSEVWLHTRTGEAYRTKTRISQWEALLDRRFLRIHRSYIVNTECIEEYHRVLRRGGILIFAVTSTRHLWELKESDLRPAV